MRACNHTEPQAVSGCRPCELWATCPEYYCLWEDLPIAQAPLGVLAAREAGQYVLWQDIHEVAHIALAAGKPIPIPAAAGTTALPPSLIQHPYPSLRKPCRHRGEEIRTVLCPTCAGTVKLKVLGCTIHGECTLAKQQPSLACCATCPDYTAMETEVPDARPT